MTTTLKTVFAALLVLALASCGEQEGKVKIGAKNFGESRILAHMMAALAEEQGLPVEGVVDYPSTQAILEALKRGDIDAYPEYNGTGLVMLGQNPISDGDAATARVKELYEPLGLSWRPRVGFANDYGLAMRPERAAELDIASMSELVSRAGNLSLGVEDDFAKRPLDGLQPMTRRYALDFARTDVVPLSDRAKLYDDLLDEKVDVIEIYTTDGQIADYGLVVLKDDLEFFPAYQISPLANAASLSAHAGLGGALDALAGKIDADQMRDLNRKVDSEGRSPRAVARDALARMNLIAAGAVATEDPLLIAASPQISEGAEADSALRAARKAFQGREVKVAPSYDALGDVGAGNARLALVAADAFFDVSTPAPTRNEAFEAVAPVGQNLIHVITRLDGPTNLKNAKTIAAGPAGSSSARIAGLLKAGLGLTGDVLEEADASAAGLTGKIRDGGADIAIVFAPEGDSELVAAMDEGSMRLLSITGWNEGANLVRYPFLREARLTGGTYPGQRGAIETLGAQLVLAGPAPQTGDIVGDLGPSAISVGLSPISGSAVADLNAAISGEPLIDPALRQAAALAPVLPVPPAAINPDADISIFNVVIVVLFVWILWLYARPEYR
jgi:glycine betaine/choline ABC-type transport system substrate-binding protein